MADTFQGNMHTISPAMGSYTIQTLLNIDKDGLGMTGSQPTGMPIGQNTLTLVGFDQGVTGLDPSQFRDLSYRTNY